MRLYLYANPIIYSIEGVPDFRAAALAWIEQAEGTAGAVITSRLSRLECRVRPLRKGNKQLLARFEGSVAREGLELAEITADVMETATALRAAHGFRAPDAIPLRPPFSRTPTCFSPGMRASPGVPESRSRSWPVPARCPELPGTRSRSGQQVGSSFQPGNGRIRLRPDVRAAATTDALEDRGDTGLYS
jgi:predicted nucleic acid-binding protein